jgi:flagellar biosynthesis protein
MTPTVPSKAVALEYGDNPVPVVVAKGEGDIATAIVLEAQRQGVAVMRDAELAARLSSLPLGDSVPRDLYIAVAVILSWVYWSEGKSPAQAKPARREPP